MPGPKMLSHCFPEKMSINSNFLEFKDSIISLTAILTTKRYTANFNNELPQKYQGAQN